MIFDPFGGFETRGYLRNLANEKDLDIVRRLEHSSFVTGLDEAFLKLSKVKQLAYDNVLATHKTLFEAVYPWAGEDRTTTCPTPPSSRARCNSLIRKIFVPPSTTRYGTVRIRRS